MNEELEHALKELIEMAQNILTSEDLDAVLHYFEHGEYEMSFEGLVIELYTKGKYPNDFIFEKWKSLAIEFKLNIESVFIENFWEKFNEWGNAYIPEC